MLGIIDLLREFSNEEMKSMELFLNSPYHNKSKKLKLLFIEIKKFYPSFTNVMLTNEYLIKKISPSLKYNDSTFRNLIADLQILIEKFLTVEQVFVIKYDQDIFLLKSLIGKNQSKLFETHLRKTLNILEKNGKTANISKPKVFLNCPNSIIILLTRKKNLQRTLQAILK